MFQKERRFAKKDLWLWFSRSFRESVEISEFLKNPFLDKRINFSLEIQRVKSWVQWNDSMGFGGNLCKWCPYRRTGSFSIEPVELVQRELSSPMIPGEVLKPNFQNPTPKNPCLLISQCKVSTSQFRHLKNIWQSFYKKNTGVRVLGPK